MKDSHRVPYIVMNYNCDSKNEVTKTNIMLVISFAQAAI